MPAGAGVPGREGKNVAGVEPAFVEGEVSLRRIGFAAYEAVGVDGDAAHVGNAAGNPFALVVAALPQPGTVQGDGYDEVDVVELPACAKLPGIELSQVAGAFFPVVVFDVVQQIPVAGVGGGIKQGKSGVDVGFPPEQLFHGMFRLFVEFGARQVLQAVQAQVRLVALQPSAAYDAQAGKQQVEKGVSRHTMFHGRFLRKWGRQSPVQIPGTGQNAPAWLARTGSRCPRVVAVCGPVTRAVRRDMPPRRCARGHRQWLRPIFFFAAGRPRFSVAPSGRTVSCRAHNSGNNAPRRCSLRV